MTMTKREKILVSVVLVLAIFCLYYLFFLMPKSKELGSLNQEIGDKEIQASTVQQEQQILQSMDKAIADNEGKLSSLSTGITTGFDQPSVLVYLQNTVNQFARKVTFTFSPAQQIGQMDVCPVSIKMLSSYDGIKQVLAALSDSPYFVKVVALQVTMDPAQQVTVTEGDGTAPVSSSPVANSGEVAVSLDIEFYGQPGTTADDAPHDFAEGYQFGGDIFN